MEIWNFSAKNKIIINNEKMKMAKYNPNNIPIPNPLIHKLYNFSFYNYT